MKKTLCVLALLACCVLFLTIPVFARENAGSCGENVFWSYDEQSETLTISGTGRVDDYFPAFMSLKEVPWKHVRNHIKRIVVESGVTYIGKYSTKDMKELQEVILADTVIELTDEQFAKCAKLEKVKLSQSLTTIGSSAFLGCTALKEISLPDSVKSVGAFAFRDCTSLESAKLSNSMDAILRDTFYNCKSLRGIRIPASVRFIDIYCFFSCSRMTEMVFMGDMPIFDGSCFFGCYATLYYPAGNSTWQGADKTTIDCYALLPMKNVADHELPKAEDPIEGLCGPNATFKLHHGELTIQGTGKVDICPWRELAQTITKVTISEGITSFPMYAFADTINLKQIKLPESLQIIPDHLFINSGITSLSIPKGVTRMGFTVFSGCENLTKVIFLGKAPQFSRGDNNANPFSGYDGYAFTVQWQSWTSKDKEGSSSGVIWAIGDGGTSGKCGDNATWKVEGDVLIISGTGKTWDFMSLQSAPWTHYRNTVKKVVVSDGITELGSDAFIWMSSIEEAEMADSVMVIGSDAFRFCNGLKSVKLSDNLKTIKEFAFLNCISLEKVVTHDSVEVIEYGVFSDCINLKEVVLSRNIKSIGQESFAFCESLEVIHFMGNAPSFHRVAFDELETTVTYPWLNTTWTNEVLKNYGGKITWQHRECKEEHTFSEWERISEPTTESTGLEKGVCSNCGFVEERVIPKLPEPSSGTTTTTTSPVTQPGIPDDDGKVTMQPRLFSDEAILVCGVIAAVFVVCSIVIFIRIAVLTQRAKKEKENEE